MDTALNILCTTSGQEISRRELISKILSSTESRLREIEFHKIIDPMEKKGSEGLGKKSGSTQCQVSRNSRAGW